MYFKNDSYYVYIYIDPRNFEEFYYGKGKGKGNRKEAHLKDQGDSDKAKRIKAIKKEGLSPIIKVIAKGLTEREAFLIEKTLIWKLGNTLTNQSSGHFADKFRPHNTLHIDLPYFDFENGIYYVNVGEGNHRCWEDCMQYGLAGQHPKYSSPMRTLEAGDIVIAYLKGFGYVGIGKVLEKAVRINDFKIDLKPLSQFDLQVPNIFNNSENENSEYPVKVEWIKAVEKNDAKWKKNYNLFTSQLIKASLEKQAKTLEFLEEEFEVDFKKLMNSQ